MRRRAQAALSRLVRVERHDLGPRLHVAGVRVHEAALGIVLLLVAVVLSLTRWGLPVHLTGGAWVAGTWMLVKDWRDLVPRWRNTASWSLGLHRPHAPLRATRRAMWLPGATAALLGLAGLGQLLRAIEPDAGTQVGLAGLAGVFGAPVPIELAAPAGLALMGLSIAIEGRRRPGGARLLVRIGAGAREALASGPRLGSALACLVLAGGLIWGRDAFWVRGDLGRLPQTRGLAPALVGGAISCALLAGLVVLNASPPSGGDRLGVAPLAAGAIGALGLIALAGLALRPPPPPERRGSRVSFAQAERLVRAHGHDTLSFFKLRGDARRLFGPGERSMLAYRIEAGVMLLSADPVGPARELPALMRIAAKEAEEHGLRLGVVGARADLLPLYRDVGLRPLYLGDEAIVDVPSFSLSGRPIRKVRQSVTRMERLGYCVGLHELGTLGTADLAELDEVSERSRGGAPERGFSMATDLLAGAHHSDSLVLVARDGTGSARGFLHLVPCFGRPALSLGMMRRDPGTPNGLMEYLIAVGIGLLAERGVEELSLNFATCGRWLRCPANRAEVALGRLVRRLDRWFQVERLHHFNAKFFPRWEPRYLCFEGPLGLPRTGLAALTAEGFIPRFGRADRPAPHVLVPEVAPE